jgi:hypothetical protein
MASSKRSGLVLSGALGIVAALALIATVQLHARQSQSRPMGLRHLPVAEQDAIVGDACTNWCAKSFPCFSLLKIGSECAYCKVGNVYNRCCQLGKCGQACTMQPGPGQCCAATSMLQIATTCSGKSLSCCGCCGTGWNCAGLCINQGPYANSTAVGSCACCCPGGKGFGR